MILPFSYALNLRCPNCAQVQPYWQLFRTNDFYHVGSIAGLFGALGRRLAFWECRNCKRKLRIADHSKFLRALLFIPLFFGSFIYGNAVLDHVSVLPNLNDGFVDYLKFITSGALSLLIALWVSTRLLKVETIE